MRSSGLRDTGVMLLGAGVGAGLMFLLDPHSGRRRRALVRDHIRGFTRDVRFETLRRGQDLINRARGQVLEWRRRAGESLIDDEMLEQRARAQVGHVVSHPGALEFKARDGVLIVTGPVLRGEKQQIEERLRKTRGVRQWNLSGIVEYGSAGNIPGLQGESRRQRNYAT